MEDTLIMCSSDGNSFNTNDGFFYCSESCSCSLDEGHVACNRCCKTFLQTCFNAKSSHLDKGLMIFIPTFVLLCCVLIAVFLRRRRKQLKLRCFNNIEPRITMNEIIGQSDGGLSAVTSIRDGDNDQVTVTDRNDVEGIYFNRNDSNYRNDNNDQVVDSSVQAANNNSQPPSMIFTINSHSSFEGSTRNHHHNLQNIAVNNAERAALLDQDSGDGLNYGENNNFRYYQMQAEQGSTVESQLCVASLN